MHGLRVALVMCVSCIYFCCADIREQELKCSAHADCAENSQFCAWTTCKDYSGWVYKCGQCKNCSQCFCNADSIDYACPQSRCPASPHKGMRELSGSWTLLSDIQEPKTYNFLCVRRVSFSGRMFSDMQMVVSLADPGRADGPNAEHIQNAENFCKPFDRSGHFHTTVLADHAVLKLSILSAREGTKSHHHYS